MAATATAAVVAAGIERSQRCTGARDSAVYGLDIAHDGLYRRSRRGRLRPGLAFWVRVASKIDWHRIPRATVVAEVLQWLIGISVLALGWVTLPLLYALCGIEIVVVVALSGVIYRMKGVGVIVADTLKSLLLWLFCGAFVIGSYAGAGGFEQGIRLEPRGFAVLAAIVALRLGLVALAARASPDPRLHWTREAAMRGAVLALSGFFAAFACFPAILLVAPIATIAPAVAPDVAIGAALLSVQAFLALVVATMTPQELAAISRKPYNDA